MKPGDQVKFKDHVNMLMLMDYDQDTKDLRGTIVNIDEDVALVDFGNGLPHWEGNNLRPVHVNHLCLAET